MAIKKYAYNSKEQLTKNTNVSELKCKGKGHKHDIWVDVDHIEKIQKFMEHEGYTKVLYTSGHRCKDHNTNIGGAKTSYHMDPNACASDVKFYDKNGKLVSAKIVCCKAQDFGFKGIGYIGTYEVHLDSRPKGSYRGDERKGYSSNVKDFYTYFGIEKPGAKTYSGTFPKLPEVKYKNSKGKTCIRTWFIKGDKGTQVKNLQKFLNWANNASLTVDGIIGNKTINQVKKFQKAVKLKEDGSFGKNSLAKAKSYKK